MLSSKVFPPNLKIITLKCYYRLIFSCQSDDSSALIDIYVQSRDCEIESPPQHVVQNKKLKDFLNKCFFSSHGIIIIIILFFFSIIIMHPNM